MTKTLLFTGLVFLLAGCTHPAAEDVQSYHSETLGISFDYPADWNVHEDAQITVSSPPTKDAGTHVTVTIPSESFETYEMVHAEFLQSQGMSVQETYLVTQNNKLFAKVYGQEGWLEYLIATDDHFVSVGSERQMGPEQEAGVGLILDSLVFKIL